MASTSAKLRSRRAALRACTDSRGTFWLDSVARLQVERCSVSAADPEPSQTRVQELEALVARMQGELAATSSRLAATNDQLAAASDRLAGVVSERDNLRRAYRQLMEQFELLRRRIFIAKAERIDATQLELEFEKTKQKLDALAKKLDGDNAADSPPDNESTGKDAAATVGSSPTPP